LKKLLTIAALALGVSAAKAQSTEFKPFRVGFDFGYAIPSGEGAKGGIIFALEPKYAMSDKLALGLRIEGAVTARSTGTVSDEFGFSGSTSAKASGSYLATADYYINTNSFRPFVGLGVGVHQLASADFSFDENASDENVAVVEGGTKLGATPRVGFDYGHFRAQVEYNMIGKTGEIKNNYLGIKLGFFLGGGRQ